MIDTKELRTVIQKIWLNGVCPAEIIELLDRLEAAEKERDNANAAAVGIALQATKLEAERDELRAKVEQMERQEPVASVWRCDNGHIHGSCERTLPMGAKLYALPGAKGE